MNFVVSKEKNDKCKDTDSVGLGQSCVMVWDPVDDQNFYHGANFEKGKKVEGDAGGDTGRGATDGEATDGEDTVRWVFVFDGLQNATGLIARQTRLWR